MRIVFNFILVITSVVIMSSQTLAAGKSESIVAIVGDNAISKSEFEDRMKLIMASSGLKPTKDNYQKLTPQVLGSLIDEEIQKQEAQKVGIEISPQEIRNGFEMVAKQNGLTAEKFEKMITGSGLNIQTMRNQIKAQLSWQKVVQKELRPKVVISTNDIQNRIDKVKRNMGQQEYLVAEIFLPVDEEENESDVKQLANRLIAQVKQDQNRFPRIARQFSKAPGAHKGGIIGWVQEGQLQPELNSALITTEAGKMTQAIRTIDGYHILFVREKREITQEQIPSEEQVKNAIGTERLDHMQRRYLSDLKASTFIDVRV